MSAGEKVHTCTSAATVDQATRAPIPPCEACHSQIATLTASLAEARERLAMVENDRDEWKLRALRAEKPRGTLSGAICGADMLAACSIKIALDKWPRDGVVIGTRVEVALAAKGAT